MTSNLNPEITVDTTSFPITVQMLKQSSAAPAELSFHLATQEQHAGVCSQPTQTQSF